MLITRPEYRNRQDPEVRELIEHFKSGKFAKIRDRDDFFSRCNKAEIELIKKEILCCQEDFRYAAKNYFTITNKDGVDMPFSLWESQELILDAMQELRQKNKPQKLIIIKARQLGCSLLIEAIMAWGTMFFPNKTALVISYDKTHAAYLFSYMYNIVFRMPIWLQPEMSTYKFEEGLVFDIPSTKMRKGIGGDGLNSRISVQWANKLTGVGQGIRVNLLHSCFTPGTLIRLGDGRYKPICEVKRGDIVINSYGELTSVKECLKVDRNNEVSSKIYLWGNCIPLETTLDHKILTPEGLKPAQEIKAGSYVSYPIRNISNTKTHVKMRSIRSGSKQITYKDVPLTNDIGWLMGFYLAEGYIQKTQRNGASYNTTVIFGIDRDEEKIFGSRVESICKTLPSPYGRPCNTTIRRRRNSRTSTINVANSSLCDFISENFGEVDNKTIPDWVFNAGEDFCLGLVEGYIAGDGHVNPQNRISVSSIRLSILLQIKDIIASLGYGLPSIKYRPAGEWYNRNCKEIWTMDLSGKAAYNLCKKIGEKVNEDFTNEDALHYKYSDSGRYIHVQVESTANGFSQDFYDLEVESGDKMFLTAQCIVKNSEFSDWYNAEQVIEEDMKYALVNDVNTIAILESTAKGVGNYAHNLWERMVELGDDAAWKPLFLPWFFEKKRVLAPPMGWKPTSEMIGVRDVVENEWVRCSNPLCLRFKNRYHHGRDITGDKCCLCNKGTVNPYVLKDNQLRFMEDERANAKDVKKVKQELATTAAEAFIVSGDPIFPDDCVDFVTQTKRMPRYTGFLVYGNRGEKKDVLFHGIDVKNNDPTKGCPLEGCTADHEHDKRDLRVWELPRKDAEYYIGVDPSNGLGGTKDHSVIWVNRIDRQHFLDIQVAMYRSNEIDPVDLAYVAARIGYWYNEAEIACEYTGLRTTADTLRAQIQYPNLYRAKNLNLKNIVTNVCGWSTNHITKPALLVQGVRSLKSKSWVIREERFLSEMKTFQKDKNTDTPNSLNNVGATKNANDDVVMAALICEFCAHEMDFDADLGYIPIKKMTLDSAPWKMRCDSCYAEWPADAPTDENNCPKCGSLLISGTRNLNQVVVNSSNLIDQVADYEWDDYDKEKDCQMY